jgi:maleylpyruvate isomerase
MLRANRIFALAQATARASRYLRDVSTDPLALAAEISRSTARLLTTARGLSDEAVAQPSLLPGWTRGHVLTHLSRNADGAVNLLTWARTGIRTPQYESMARRAADIDDGAGRAAAVQVEDLAAACERFAAAVDAMPAQAWTSMVETTSGRQLSAAQFMWFRLREVEIHHVDLDAGYGPDDWPDAFALRLCRTVTENLAKREDGPRLIVRAPEVGHDLVLGDDAVTSPVVSGPARAVGAWLIGRSDGSGLTVTPSGPLPPVPPLG